MNEPGRLVDEIKALIVENGPVSLERFMGLALGHPRFGYYRTRDPFGPAGDFVTAPEISQMFGELLGLWAAMVWAGLGSPDPVRLVELGPGRGTLMADALRAARALPPFRAALDIHLVETSPVLREAQRARLTPFGLPIAWHDDIAEVPPGPMILLANEFFDALPVRHYLRLPQGWCERLVGLREGALVFGAAPDPEPSLTLGAPDGAIVEIGLAGRRVAAALGARLQHQGGAALFIDYGYAEPRLGETLQAVKAHRFVDPLAEPGEADLTTHVDFTALARAARAAGADVHGPVRQGGFLVALGLHARADMLRRTADPSQREAIDAAVKRLTDPGTPRQPGMGDLFKVMAFTAPGLPVPPGFADRADPAAGEPA